MPLTFHRARLNRHSWLCQACNLEVREDQEHLTVCEGYQDLRGDADLGNEEELVNFLNRVMERRKENDWN